MFVSSSQRSRFISTYGLLNRIKDDPNYFSDTINSLNKYYSFQVSVHVSVQQTVMTADVTLNDIAFREMWTRTHTNAGRNYISSLG